jgi:hypothetical protein
METANRNSDCIAPSARRPRQGGLTHTGDSTIGSARNGIVASHTPGIAYNSCSPAGQHEGRTMSRFRVR